MKNFLIKLVIIFIFFCSVLFTGCGGSSNQKNDKIETGQTSGDIYTCSMHPEVKSNKTGECPKCGMELILSDNI